MTQSHPTLADRFAGLRQELSADAGSPGFGLEAAVLAMLLHLLSMLERMARNWEAGLPTRPRFRRHRRGLRPYRRRPRVARRRSAPRRRQPHARTPSGVPHLPCKRPPPPSRTGPPARASPARRKHTPPPSAA